jgi:hypothetical protein
MIQNHKKDKKKLEKLNQTEIDEFNDIWNKKLQ